MNKKLILDRLELLVKLCEKTEPDINSLFQNQKYTFLKHNI